MSKLYDGSEFDAYGRTFRVRIKTDDCGDSPMDNEDGHGPVRQSRSADKRAGERVLHKDRHTHWFYDWQAACKMARKDGWDAAPYGEPNRIERAVKADFDYLRRWLSGDWCYVGVVVEMLDEDGDVEDNDSLWGIESDAYDYIDTTALEMAREIASRHGLLIGQRLDAWRAALREARERRYWAARDVQTMGA